MAIGWPVQTGLGRVCVGAQAREKTGVELRGMAVTWGEQEWEENLPQLLLHIVSLEMAVPQSLQNERTLCI